MSNIYIDRKWVSSGNVSWGGARAWLTATLTPNSDRTSLTLKVKLDNYEFYDKVASGSGCNSWYLFAFVPMRGASAAYASFHNNPDLKGYYHRQGTAHGSSEDEAQFNTLNEDVVWADIAEAVDDNYESTVSGHLVVGLLVPCTSAAAFFDSAGLSSVNQEKTFTIATNPSTDYDANGKYIGSKPILVAGNRFWNFGSPPFDGDEGFIPSDSVSGGDRIVEVWAFEDDDHHQPILFDYFPGAIKKSTSWESHNRTAGPDQPGRVAIKSGSDWIDCKNQFGSSAPADNKGNIRKSGSWTRQDLIGENA